MKCGTLIQLVEFADTLSAFADLLKIRSAEFNAATEVFVAASKNLSKTERKTTEITKRMQKRLT